MVPVRPRRPGLAVPGLVRVVRGPSRPTCTRAWCSPATRTPPGRSTSEAEAWYYHRFYDFQPDLNMANPRVRQEIEKIIGFWLQLGVAGFRLDAAPFIIELTVPGDPSPRQDFAWLDDLRDQIVVATRRRRHPGRGQRRARAAPRVLRRRPPAADAVQLHPQPADVPGPGPRRGRRRSCRPWPRRPPLPDTCQWATFLRNHDEVDLGRLVGHEHDEVFAAFGPEPDMQLYGRGIRRRLAPDARQRPAADRDGLRPAVQPARHPGHPLRRRDRHGRGPVAAGAQRHPHADAVERTRPTAASRPPRRKRDLRRPVITDGDFGYETVNVEAQQRDPDSLLSWFQRALLDAARVPRVRHRHLPLRRHRGPGGARPRARRAERVRCSP